jgi:NADPH2:quinone reductase
VQLITIREHGGPDVLGFGEAADPEPGPGQVVIDVDAAGVNFIDTYFRRGVYPRDLPFVPGSEAAGTISAIGPDVTGFAVGDRVGSVEVQGAYAQRALVNADRLVRVPDGLAPKTAAGVLLQGMTAHYLTRSVYRVQPGDTVLVHAAAGGMGLLLTQLVKLFGGRVIGTVSTAEKERLARAAGADEIIRYTDTEVAPVVRELTGGAGVAAVYDGVGAPTFEASLASLRPRGTLAIYGQSGGVVPPLDIQRLNQGGSLFLTRPSLGHYIAEPDELAERSTEVLGWVRSGELDVHIGAEYPLAEAARAHADLEGRRTTGKLLLVTA